MILQHHERLDGSGYPHGLRGEQISTGSRMITIAVRRSRRRTAPTGPRPASTWR